MSFASVKLVPIQYITGSKKSLGSIEQEETSNAVLPTVWVGICLVKKHLLYARFARMLFPGH